MDRLSGNSSKKVDRIRYRSNRNERIQRPSVCTGNHLGRGRPRGSRNKTTLVLQKMLGKHAEALVSKCVVSALQGEMLAMRLCMERLLPPLKHSPVQFTLPSIATHVGIGKAFEQLLESVAQGQISPADAQPVANMLEQRLGLLEGQRMSRSCVICRKPERSEIDNALIENQSLRDIAKRFGTTSASLHRHRQHLPIELSKANQAQDTPGATTLLDWVESLIGRLENIAEQAQKEHAWSAAAGAIREIRGCLTMLAQRRGELQTGTRRGVNVTISVEQIRAAVRAAHPEQFAALTRELLDNATEEQFAAMAEANGVKLPPPESVGFDERA